MKNIEKFAIRYYNDTGNVRIVIKTYKWLISDEHVSNEGRPMRKNCRVGR